MRSDDETSVPVAFVVTSARISDYSGAAISMLPVAIDKYIKRYNAQPSQADKDHYVREFVRLVVARDQVMAASNLEIRGPKQLLKG